MITIEFKIDASQVAKKVRELNSRVEECLLDAVNQSLLKINNTARINLDSSIKWGHSFNTSEQIMNSVEMNTYRDGPYTYRGSLTYNSPHALAVEYGHIGVRRAPGEGPFPIGKQQFGTASYYSHSIPSVPGKFFLTTAFITCEPEINEIHRRALQRALRSI